MTDGTNELLGEVAVYYSNRLAQHGQTAAGVDWRDTDSQILRFDQLLKLVAAAKPYTLCDIGCGYGALLDYISDLGHSIRYIGLDVSSAMVNAARQRFVHNPNARFEIASRPDTLVDYSVASGIFNVKLERSQEEWEEYLLETLDVMNEVSTRGFAFNCLTSYSDADKMRRDLFYADPLHLFHICKSRYSRHVALLHDYGLYEFTMIVRK
ncbi:class I SAM-dependent methyltransferase [Rhizobium sp. GCM10022189]|uniref:class I SAM-dependent methyltransferase n=1 Tax=Rhizobium sp. GCM10022189 TaxID=3252654 RepID=UPI00361E1824